MDGRIKLRPGLDFSRPFRKERHVGAAFEQRELPAAIGLIDIGQADIGCATIIAGEELLRILSRLVLEDRLLGQSLCVKR